MMEGITYTASVCLEMRGQVLTTEDVGEYDDMDTARMVAEGIPFETLRELWWRGYDEDDPEVIGRLGMLGRVTFAAVYQVDHEEMRSELHGDPVRAYDASCAMLEGLPGVKGAYVGDGDE